MRAFEYVTAESFAAATAFLADQSGIDTLVKAGGTDLLDRLKERLETPARLLNLSRVRQAGGQAVRRRPGDLLAIPALATLAEVSGHELLRKSFPLLAAAAGQAATPQIRSLATVGGNLCQKPRCWYYRSQNYPCLKKGGSTCYALAGENRYHALFGAGACHIVHPSSLAVPLLACAARLRLTGRRDGKQIRRLVDLDDFFRVPADPTDQEHTLAPGELLEEVLLPLERAGPHAAYVELRHKQSFDWPLVSCAVNLNKPGQPRVVLGAVAPIPWRLRNVEALVAAGKLDDRRRAAAGRLATRGARPLAHNGYKLQLVTAAVERALRQAAAGK